MKTKLSKKILSAFLAMLMVVTSVPLASVTAFAADDAAVTEVKNAMAAFEAQLQTEGAFTNVTNAYNAYVDCQKALDAYIYGGETDALSGKASDLNTAISQIGTFTGATAKNNDGYTQLFADDSANYPSNCVNVLWAETNYSTTRGTGTGDYHKIDLYYPEVTYLYDGKTTPKSPVVILATGTGDAGFGRKKNRTLLTAFFTADGLGLTENWRGKTNGNLDSTWAWGADSATDRLSYINTGFNGASAHVVRENRRDNYKFAFANIMSFTGSLSDTEFSKDYTPSIQTYFNSASTWTTTDGANLAVTGNKAVHVVNYNALTVALATNGSKMKQISPSEFSEGGLSTYIAAMDAATSFDPNTYFKSSNDYTGCATKISQLVDDMNKAPVNVKDSADYEALRNAMNESVRAQYSDGNTGYTTESWDEFVKKYDAAKAIMAACNDTGYTSTSAATAATELTEAYGALQTLAVKVNTTSLVSAIDAFQALDSKYFTAESYAAVKQVVDAAKVAVWGAVDEYNIPTSALDDSTEAQTTVANQTTNVNEAVKLLRFSPDSMVNVSGGDKYSLNSAIALKDTIADPTDYGNYSDFSGQITAANEYIASMANTEFTDFNTQLADYTAAVQAVVDAYNALTYAFTKIPDGTLANTGSLNAITTLEDHKNSDGYNYYFDFSYPSSGVIIKTTHDAKTVNYGETYLTYKMNLSNNESKINNGIDSITINGTADANTQINSKNATDTPKALSDAEKATYAGCLAVDGFSLRNFRVNSVSNFGKSYFATNADGTTISDYIAPNDEYTTIIGTTDGTSTYPTVGMINLQHANDGDCSITLESDMSIDIPATTAATLSATTKPAKTIYNLSGHYLGITYVWNTQPTLAYAGYGYVTTKSNNQMITSSVTVIDISYLVDLVNVCTAMLGDEEMYTEDSWATFAEALKDAQADIDYISLASSSTGVTQLYNRCTARYTTLWNAKEALVKKTFNIAFNYKDANGADATTSFVATYGETLNDYASTINKINTPQYVADNRTYTFKEWTPSVNLDTPITADATYTATYDSVLNQAVFTAYNTAKAQLLGLLVDDVYTTAALNSLKAEVDGMTYFLYDDAQKEATMADHQAAIDAETEKINTLISSLTPAGLDLSTAKATVAEAKMAGGDVDRYDLSGFDFDYESDVVIAGVTVKGLTFGDKDELDLAIQAALESIQTKTYKIYLNGNGASNVVVADVPYGTPVIVNSDGTYVLDAADTNVNYDGASAGWTYSYNAPSRGTAGATIPKYMLSAPSLGFIVKGDTYLTAAVADETGSTYVVTVKSSTGKVIDMASTSGSYTMPTAPSYFGYTFDSYDNRASAGDVINVSADTTIIANYTANSASNFTITTAACLDDLLTGVVTVESYAYNTKVNLSNPDAYCWVVADMHYDDDNGVYNDKYKLVSFNAGAYSFYACESFELTSCTATCIIGKCVVPLTYDEYEAFVLDSTTIETVVGGGYSTSFNEEATDVIYDGAGNPVYCSTAKKVGAKPPHGVVDAPKATVSSLSTVLNKETKFAMIGTFTLPEGYEIVECGFLFTSDTTVTDMTVEKVGTNGISRMKSSIYTVGNQFVINITNPSTTVTFKYAPYAIVKDADGNVDTVYGTAFTGSNNF